MNMRTIMKYTSVLTAVCLASMLSFACAQDDPATPTSGVREVAGDSPATESSDADGRLDLAKKVFKDMGKGFAPLVEDIDGGEIDWTNGRVLAIGHASAKADAARGRLMAMRGARLVAARNSLLVLHGIRPGPGGTFQNVKEGWIKVDAVVKDFEEVSSEYDAATRTATVKLAVPLYGAQGVVKTAGLVYGKAPADLIKPAGKKKGEPKLIIIDARGTGFKPTLTPILASVSGKELFEASLASPKPEGRSPVIYVTMNPQDKFDLPATQAAEGFGGPALIYQAQKSPAKNPGTISLADSDVDDMISYIATGGLLTAGKVVVVTDPQVAAAATTKPTGS